jgi:hypothetical protein
VKLDLYLSNAQSLGRVSRELDVDIGGYSARLYACALHAEDQARGETVADCSSENASSVRGRVATERGRLIHRQIRELALVELGSKFEAIELLYVNIEGVDHFHFQAWSRFRAQSGCLNWASSGSMCGVGRANFLRSVRGARKFEAAGFRGSTLVFMACCSHSR